MEHDIELLLKLAVNSQQKLAAILLLHNSRYPLSPLFIAKETNYPLSEIKSALEDMTALKLLRSVPDDKGMLHYSISSNPRIHNVLKALHQLTRNPEGRASVNKRIHDFHIEDSIRTILNSSDRIYARDITTVCYDGTVYLKGSVNTAREIEEIEILLHPFKDRLFLRKIKNQLALVTQRYPDDQQLLQLLTHNIEEKSQAYMQANSIKLYSAMEISVFNRVAYLDGLCPDLRCRREILNIALGTKGIIHVVQYLSIGETVDEGMNWAG